jgi:hypothetical protein
MRIFKKIIDRFYNRGWVDVNDRLPKPAMIDGDFSFDLLTYSRTCGYYVMAYDFKHNCWVGSDFVNISHWRELPDSPKRKQTINHSFNN